MKCWPGHCNNTATYIVIYGCYNHHIHDHPMCQYHMTTITKHKCDNCGQPIAAYKYLPYNNKYEKRYINDQ